MLKITPNETVLVPDSTVGISLFAALSAGSLTNGLVWHQLIYLAGWKWGKVQNEFSPVRRSYTKLQKDLPFIDRRTIINVVSRLEKMGALSVVRDGKVNEFHINGHFGGGVEASKPNRTIRMISKELAKRIGPLEAYAIQQLHLYGKDEGGWVERSLSDLRKVLFPFVSRCTTERLFASLTNRKLLEVERGRPNKYRVNYKQVQQVLDAQPFDMEVAVASNWWPSNLAEYAQGEVGDEVESTSMLWTPPPTPPHPFTSTTSSVH